MADNIQLDLSLDAGPAERAVKQFMSNFEQEADKTSKEVDTKFSGSMKKIAVAVAAAFSVKKLIDFTRESVALAQVQEDAVNSMNTALKLSGEYSAQASQDMQMFASQLQEVTRFGDETTLSMIALAKNMGASNQQAKDVVKVASDVASALKIDFGTAVRGVSQTLDGSAGMLGRYIGELRNMSPEALKAGKGLELLASKFAGAAQADINTYAGATKQLDNAWGDFKESVGEIITQSPALRGLIQMTTKDIQGLTTATKEFNDRDWVKASLDKLIPFAIGVNDWIVKPIMGALRLVQATVYKIAESFYALLNIVGKVAGGLGKVIGLVTDDSIIGEGLQSISEQTDQWFKDSAQLTKDAFSKAMDWSSENSIDLYIERLVAASEQVGLVVDGMNQKVVGGAKKTAEELSAVTQTINKALNDSLVRAAGMAAEKLGQSLVKGGMSFKSFKQFALEQIGDMAIFVGKAILAMALTVETFKDSIIGAPGAAIAAAIGLIALGAAIKAYAGSSGGSEGATSGGGVMAGSEAATGAGTDLISQEEGAPQEPKTAINLTIQGDILDSDQTSLRIVDLLNSAFENQGAVLRTT